VVVLAVALAVIGCGLWRIVPRHSSRAADALPVIVWPAPGDGRPVLGADLYARDNYPAAEVKADGQRTLSYIKNVLKADAVGIVWNFFATSDGSDSVETTSATLSASNVGILSKIAARDHLLVEYRPIILVPSETNPWAGQIAPSDPSRWFSSYYRAELPYLRTAQELGVSEFVTATELHLLNSSPLWSSFFGRVSHVYHGVISYAAWDYDYFPPYNHILPLKYLGMDMYWHMGNLPADATSEQVTRAWEVLFGELPASVLQRTAIDETGIQARAGAYANPGDQDLPGRLSEQVQANWFIAACETVHLYHMRGVFFWKVDLTDNPAYPASSLSTFEGREGAATISECARILQ
jgi:hypothetical protein